MSTNHQSDAPFDYLNHAPGGAFDFPDLNPVPKMTNQVWGSRQTSQANGSYRGYPVLNRQSHQVIIRVPATGHLQPPPARCWQSVGAQLPAKILIVDDHPGVRKGVRRLLDWHSLEVCGEARNGKEAIEQVQKLKPEIVLLDISMPVMNGIQAAYEIRSIAPSTKIVVFTDHDSPQVVSAMHLFADAFVSKNAAGTELIPTLNRLIPSPPGVKAKSRSTSTS